MFEESALVRRLEGVDGFGDCPDLYDSLFPYSVEVSVVRDQCCTCLEACGCVKDVRFVGRLDVGLADLSDVLWHSHDPGLPYEGRYDRCRRLRV